MPAVCAPLAARSPLSAVSPNVVAASPNVAVARGKSGQQRWPTADEPAFGASEAEVLDIGSGFEAEDELFFDAASLSSRSSSPSSESPLSQQVPVGLRATPALERSLRGLQSPEAEAAFAAVAIERQSPGALFDEEEEEEEEWQACPEAESSDTEVAAEPSQSGALLAAIESPLPLPMPSLTPNDVQAVLISGTNVVRRTWPTVSNSQPHCVSRPLGPSAPAPSS